MFYAGGMDASEIQTVAGARAGLTTALRRFRNGDATPMILGSHRRAEAVLIPYAQYTTGLTARRGDETLLNELRRRRALVLRLAEHAHLTDVQVTGSVARGEDHEDSDVDLIVTPAPDATLLDLAQFELDMELLLGRKVEVLSSRALDPQTDARLLSDAVPL